MSAGHGLHTAVRAAVADLAADELVLVGCSGGADSLALAIGAADMMRRGVIRAGAIVVDHQLQKGSGETAAAAAARCRQLGLDPVEVVAVSVSRGPGNGGIEAAARDARRAALTDAAARHGAKAVLLAHTLDDQAETVLLGLARGSGARSLAGIKPVDGLWRRPLLGLRRADTEAACRAGGLEPYIDPHNSDPKFARVRVRTSALPQLERELGPGIAAALARTAAQLQDDTAALDAWASEIVRNRNSTAVAFEVEELAGLPRAVRTRVLRLAMIEGGCPPGRLNAGHIDSADLLITNWRGQGAIRLPGERELVRESAKLVVHQAPPLTLTRSLDGTADTESEQ